MKTIIIFFLSLVLAGCIMQPVASCDLKGAHQNPYCRDKLDYERHLLNG